MECTQNINNCEDFMRSKENISFRDSDSTDSLPANCFDDFLNFSNEQSINSSLPLVDTGITSKLIQLFLICYRFNILFLNYLRVSKYFGF